MDRRHHLYPLETEFVYLAVVLDAYSRRVIGWALDRTLEMIWRLLLCKWPSRAQTARRIDPSLRPGRAICLARLHRLAERSRRHHQHEPERKSIRQCVLRVLHETLKYEEVHRQSIATWPTRVLPSSGLSKRLQRKRLHSALTTVRRSSSNSRCRYFYFNTQHFALTKLTFNF